MSTVNWPGFKIAAADYGIDFDVQITTMRNGRVYTYGLPGARWTVTLTFPDDIESGQRPAIEAFITSLEGGANRVSLGHLGRKYPNGGLRGSPTLSGNHAQGAKQLSLASCNAGLKAGDIIGVPGQMLMVTADATPTGGSMTVSTRPALFTAYSDGTAVTWNQPTTLWIPKTSTAGPFPFRPGRSRPGLSIDLVETGT